MTIPEIELALSAGTPVVHPRRGFGRLKQRTPAPEMINGPKFCVVALIVVYNDGIHFIRWHDGTWNGFHLAELKPAGSIQ